MLRELVFATSNEHKLAEVQMLLGNSFILKSLADIGCTEDIEETGLTFRDNASIKSRFIYSHFQRNCFADDSGLEVDGLNGEPGVYSARYSGSRDSEQNLQLVLKKMEHVANRKARFRCVLSLILGGEEYFFEGTVEGVILPEKSGLSGFGYDPIFRPDGYKESFAEMPASLKNSMSHRGRAISKMLSFLRSAGS